MIQNIRQGGWWAWSLLVVVVLLAAAPILTYPLGRDQGEFAAIGAVILRGGVPYLDVWNPKPPAIFYIYAGLLRAFGENAWAVRTLDLFSFPLMAAALYGAGRRLTGRALGLWAVLFYAVAYFTESFWTLSQNDGTAAVPMALAVWGLLALLDAPPSRRSVALAVLVGSLAALTLWFKYPYIVFIGGLVAGYLIGRRRLVAGEMMGFVGGGLLVGLGGMGLLASVGAFGAWVESARVTAGYTAQGYDPAVFWADMARYAAWRWEQWGVLWVLAGLGILLVAGSGRAENVASAPESDNPLVTDRLRWTIIVIWLVTSAAAMLIQAKGYDYHWLPMLPALSLLGAYPVNQVAKSIRSTEHLPQWTMPAIVTPLVLGCIFYLAGQLWGTALPYLSHSIPKTAYYSQFIGGQFVAAESEQVASYLRSRTNPGEALFVWGFRPELYTLTRTRPATRFIFQFPLVAGWYPPVWRDQTVQTLWAAPPPYVVVARGDDMPWVTGRHADSNTLLQEYTDLNNWLIFNYEQEVEIGSFLVWQLKDDAAG